MRHRPMQKTCVPFATWILLCSFFFAAAPFANAQDSAVDTAGADLARAILHKRQQSVAVIDFSGPGQKVTALGEQLADSLSASVAKAGKKLRVEDRSKVTAIREQNSFAPEIVLDAPSALVLAHDLNVQAVVTGDFDLGQNGVLVLELKAYRVSNGNGIVGVKMTMPLTRGMERLITESASPRSDSLVDFTKKPSPSGYKPPRCLYCPRAYYTPKALKRRIQGTVILDATVGLDGRATDIAVIKALPEGLTPNCVEALKIWRLTPATGPDGKPTPARQRIEMSFELTASPDRGFLYQVK